jgi:23S rRNA pseudouridine1911/1915/1917 synthase
VGEPAQQKVSTHHVFTVPTDLDGSRLDSALAEIHEPWTRSRVRKLIDEGHVVVNGKNTKASLKVRENDEIVVNEPAPVMLEAEAEDIPLSILYEDEDLLVIDKPTNLVIHPAAGNPKGTLVNALLHHCDDLSGIGGVYRPGIVHRLDKDTTGVLVVAKSDRAHLALSLDFRNRKIGKTYLAVCYGTPKQEDGVIDAPIDRNPRDRQQMAVVSTGRPARTLYHVDEDWDFASLVSCKLVTGRTHQIRVHMAHIGHALVGDPLYAGRQFRNIKDAEIQARCRKFPRQALHAWKLEFVHPVTREEVSFEAPVPPDLEELLEVLRSSTHQS